MNNLQRGIHLHIPYFSYLDPLGFIPVGLIWFFNGFTFAFQKIKEKKVLYIEKKYVYTQKWTFVASVSEI